MRVLVQREGATTVKIVSSAKIKSNIKERLVSTYDNVSFFFHANIDEAKEDLQDAEVLITYGEDLTPEHIDSAKKLKWIMVISAGLEKMPFDAIAKRDIVVTNARGIHAKPMAEYTFAMMLQVARNTKTVIEHEKQANWDRTVPMREINGKTIAILGAGAIGAEIARIAKAFNMKTIGLNRSGKSVEHVDRIFTFSELNVLLKEADYVVSVLPSTKETDGMLTKAHFQLMKAEAVFINIGRGTTVVEQELIECMQQGEIAHAVLDVFEEEPLQKDHPFWTMDNVTVTPHLSGISAQYQPRAFDIFEQNLKAYTNEESSLINMIDVTRGY